MEQYFEQSSGKSSDQEQEVDYIAQVDGMLRLLPFEEGLIYIEDLHQLCGEVDFDTLTRGEKEFYLYIYSLSLEDF